MKENLKNIKRYKKQQKQKKKVKKEDINNYKPFVAELLAELEIAIKQQTHNKLKCLWVDK